MGRERHERFSYVSVETVDDFRRYTPGEPLIVVIYIGDTSARRFRFRLGVDP